MIWMPRKRKIWIIAIALLVAAALIWGLMPEAAEVETSKAEIGPMVVTVDEEGKTRVSERFVLSAPVAGYMRRVTFEAGDVVAKGQSVVTLEPLRSEVLDPRSRAAAEAAVAAAEAELRSAKENMQARRAASELAASELQRAAALFEKGHIAESALERAESNAKQSDANLSAAASGVKTAEAELRRARAALGYSPAEERASSGKAVEVRSPVAGSVLKLHRESEGAVAAGEPLVDIGNTASLEVWAEVLSTDAVSIKPGAPVYFERWGGKGRLEGRVRVVEPAAFTKVSSLGVEEQRVIVISDITSEPSIWQRLGDGFRVEAKFVVWQTEKALKVPVSALFRSGADNAVFVVVDGRAYERVIKTGHINGIAVEVTEGLAAGDEVIVHPDDALRDGAKVKPQQGR